VLVVFAGRNDDGKASGTQVASAAGAFFRTLRSDLPSSRIVIVGPVATDATAPSGATATQDALKTLAGSIPNNTFIDPLAENWFASAPSGMIAPDGQHPTDAGHKHLADKLGADPVRLGVASAS
jgi:hypothetical protein